MYEKERIKWLDVCKGICMICVVLSHSVHPPEIVAEAMKTAVQAYRPFFQAIEFAVYCPPRADSNYRVFERMLGCI